MHFGELASDSWKVSFYIYNRIVATFLVIFDLNFTFQSMDLPSRSEILFHRPVWGANPFLLCHTVTPPEVRHLRSCCNCRDCYVSRVRTVSNYLSHPFGSHSDPPRGRYELSRVLRYKLDMDRDVFAVNNSVVLLQMIGSEPICVATSMPIVPVMSVRSIEDLVRDLLVSDSGNRSLNGLFFDRLQIFDLRRKGPRLLRRARRSHAIRPLLYDLPETYDPWTSTSFVSDEVQLDVTNSVATFPSSIERLVFEKHFHGRRGLTYEFSDSSTMSKPPTRRPKRNRSLVSFYDS